MTPMSMLRTRWAAVGAAVAITLGAGGIASVRAVVSSGERPVYIAITPCRLMDTRPPTDNVGPRTTPLGPGDTYTVIAHGSNGECSDIPSDAVALQLNVTAVGATEPTFLTIWPTGEARPLASSLNPAAGAGPTPNAVTTQVSADGRFDVYNHAGTVNVLADIVGYYVDHNHDDRYLEAASPVVLIEPVGGWRFATATTPTTVEFLGHLMVVSANGAASLPLQAPVAVGGTNYQLSQVEYCIRAIAAGARVDGATVFADTSNTGGSILVQVVQDLTDRTAIGCHRLDVPAGSGYAHSLVLAFAGGAMNIAISGVRTTWVPVGGGVSMAQESITEAPQLGFDELFSALQPG